MRALSALFVLGALTLAAQTEDRVRRSVPLTGPGRLIVNVEGASIQVQPGSAQAVEVELYFRGSPATRRQLDRFLEDFTFDVSQTGPNVWVTSRNKRGWSGRLFRFDFPWRSPEFRIEAPRVFNVEANTSGGSITVGEMKGEVRVRTSGGSLSLGRIDGPVDGRTSGGSIALRGATGRATLHTSGGSIRIEQATGDVDAETSGGSIDISGTAGRVTAHTSGGGITAREASGPVDVSTSGGSISVTLAGNRGYDIDARTSGGSVNSDFAALVSGERRPEQLRGPVNGGGALVRLRTSGGGIRIRKAS
jgi:hypothetical protein